MNPILLQTIYYTVVMLIAFLFVAFIQRNFFWPFFRVKSSFGKLILVKLRDINRDWCVPGHIEDGDQLVYKTSRSVEKRLTIPRGQNIFYRFMGVTTCDIDNQKNAFCTVDYEAVTGFDAERQNDLLKRALKKPALKEPIIIIILVVAIIGAIAGLFALGIAIKNGDALILIKNSLTAVQGKLDSGTIVGGAKL